MRAVFSIVSTAVLKFSKLFYHTIFLVTNYGVDILDWADQSSLLLMCPKLTLRPPRERALHAPTSNTSEQTLMRNSREYIRKATEACFDTSC